MLGTTAEQLVRKSEPIYKEKFEGKEFSEDEWLDIFVQFPILIERPIVVKDDKAIIARPPELLKEFLRNS
jgi:arsenate reductase (glutaredoxin)